MRGGGRRGNTQKCDGELLGVCCLTRGLGWNWGWGGGGGVGGKDKVGRRKLGGGGGRRERTEMRVGRKDVQFPEMSW